MPKVTEATTTVPPVPTLGQGYITDLAGLLHISHQARLRQGLDRLESWQGNKCCVLVIKSLSIYKWTRKNADLFAKTVFENSSLGEQDLLLLVSVKDKLGRIRFGSKVPLSKGRAIKKLMMVDFPLDMSKNPDDQATVRAVEKAINIIAPRSPLPFNAALVFITALGLMFLYLSATKGGERVASVTASIVGIPIL